MRLAILVLLIIAVEAAWLVRFEMVPGLMTNTYGAAYRLDRWTGEICVFDPFMNRDPKCKNKIQKNEDPKDSRTPESPKESKGFTVDPDADTISKEKK